VPKTVKKFGVRYMLAGERTHGLDLSRHAGLLQETGVLVLRMVKELHRAPHLEKVKAENEDLRQLEAQASQRMLEALGHIYKAEPDPIRILVLKDLSELLEKVYDRCRQTGDIVFHIVLKNS
jgi:uncharacterized protein